MSRTYPNFTWSFRTYCKLTITNLGTNHTLKPSQDASSQYSVTSTRITNEANSLILKGRHSTFIISSWGESRVWQGNEFNCWPWGSVQSDILGYTCFLLALYIYISCNYARLYMGSSSHSNLFIQRINSAYIVHQEFPLMLESRSIRVRMGIDEDLRLLVQHTDLGYKLHDQQGKQGVVRQFPQAIWPMIYTKIREIYWFSPKSYQITVNTPPQFLECKCSLCQHSNRPIMQKSTMCTRWYSFTNDKTQKHCQGLTVKFGV